MSDLRKPFPLTERTTYLNIANHSPPSLPVKKAISDFLEDWDRLERKGDMKVEEANRSFARLINAKPEEIACQPNTSRGLATVAASLDYPKDCNIVVNDLENWANIYPWTSLRSKGVEVRIVEGEGGAVQYDDLESEIDQNTKVLSISHVQWLTGARAELRPLADLIHANGGLLVVDGIQAAGAVEVDVKKDDVDFYACGSYKWLLGPSGAGFLYAKEDHHESLKPKEYGYRAIAEHSLETPALKDTAQRLEFGEPSYLSFVGTKAGIDLMLGLGTDRIERQILSLAQKLYDGVHELTLEIVSPENKDLRSGVISFTAGKDEEIFDQLTRRGYIISLRPAGIRISTGFYNSMEEIERLLGDLEDIVR
ncbi:aminotransferase class V-fold PLP-dependent enzyme [Candidatus Bathyarchaeota archaeon]|nr:aminotransferase class V-fold PLP-dependent enzyme [Candidatus Bathyarchaeota archaeon]